LLSGIHGASAKQTLTGRWNSSSPGSCMGGRMKCRHKPSSLQAHHELLPTRPNRLHTRTHSPKRPAHPRSPMPPLSALTACATHARPLLPAALASVPYGRVLVRVRAPSRGHEARPQSGLGVGCKLCSSSKKLPMPPLSTLTARATHARTLLPAALASVPYGFVLIRLSSSVG